MEFLLSIKTKGMRICLMAFLLFFSLNLSTLYGQNPYYDAFALVANGVDDDGNLITNSSNAEILAAYLPKGEDRSVDSIAAQWRRTRNPFFELSGRAQGQDSAMNIAGIFNPIPSLAGLNATVFADGLARFLVERTKEELSAYFFENLKKDLEDLEELRILLPKTYELLLGIGDEIYNFNAYINMLREVFTEDLKTLVPNLRVLINSPLLDRYLTLNPTIKTIFVNALLIGEELQLGTHPADILTLIKNANLANTTIRNLAPSLQVLDLLSVSLKSRHPDRHWVNRAELNVLFQDRAAFKVYLGLIYAQCGDITFVGKEGKPLLFRNVLKQIADTWDEVDNAAVHIEQYVRSLIDKAALIETHLENVKALEPQNVELGHSERQALFIASIDLIDHAVKIRNLPYIGERVYFDIKGFEKYITIAKTASDLYLAIREQNYFNAVLNLNVILQNTLVKYPEEWKTYGDQLADMIKLIDAANQDNYLQVAHAIVALINRQGAFGTDVSLFVEIEAVAQQIIAQGGNIPARLKTQLRAKLNELKAKIIARADELEDEGINKKFLNVLPLLLKYGNLAACIAEADSAAQVKEIIESFALPAGSSSIKRKTERNVSLNAYVGISPAVEYSGATEKSRFNFSIHSPVGVAFSKGKFSYNVAKNTYDEKGSKTWFISVIDVGAFTSYRFGDEDLESLPEIKFQNILAPGLYYVRGLPNSPIAIGAGGQMGPEIRDLAEGVVEKTGDPSFSFRVFISVDIPIINFFSKPRTRK